MATGRTGASATWRRKRSLMPCFLRFWWEAEGVFTKLQKAALLNASLSRIICDNTGITQLLPDSFLFRRYPSGYTSCGQLPSVDLEAWREEESPGGLEENQRGRFGDSWQITTLLNSRAKMLRQAWDGGERGLHFVFCLRQTGRLLLLLPWFPVEGCSCHILQGNTMESSTPPL